MKNMMKVVGMVAVLGITGLSLLLVFGLITTESLIANAGRILAGAAVLAAGAAALSMLGGGRSSTDETEPPPTL